MKMARLAASIFALAIFALPAAAQQTGTGASANPPAAMQPAGDVQQALKDFLADTRPVNQLTLPELRRRLKAGRDLAQNQSLDPASLRQVRLAMKDLRTELQQRQNAGGSGAAGQQAAGQKNGAQGQGNQNQSAGGTSTSATGQQAGGSAAQAAPQGQSGAAATGQAAAGSMTLDQLLADTRPASSLSPAELRQRFSLARSFMTNPGLKPEQRQSLQTLAREARTELGTRAKGAGQGQAGATTGQQQAGTAQGNGAGQQQGGTAAGQTPQTPLDLTTILNDNRPLNTLSTAELRNRILSIRQILQQQTVPQPQKKQLASIMRATRAELVSRKAAAGNGLGGQAGGQNQGGQAQGNGQQGGVQTPGNGLAPPVVSQDAEKRAQSLINDSRRAEQMSNPDLRQRLQNTRDLLQANQLTPATERALRLKLRADRDTLRGRLGGGMRMGGQQGGAQAGSGAMNGQVSINVILADKRPPNQLQAWELRRRINVLRDALLNQQLEAGRRAEWQMILERDRQFLHQQLMTRRQARMQELKRERQNNQININLGMQFDPGRRPPPPSVFAAEADDQQLADTLSAPPRRAISRRYTIQEVENSPDLRDALPRVEVDTIHFGFGESYVREEEVGNLDHVAAVLEKILTVNPREVFIIEGHTDAVGSPDANLELSRKRAEAVKQALADYYVIPPENLQTVGYGERFLKIPTPDPEPENRRVSIVRATPLVGELGQ